MDGTVGKLLIAAVFFVSSHFIMSGPLRKSLRSALGEPTFLLVYSLVSLLALTWMIVAFDRADAGEPLYDGMALVPWLAASVLTLVAMTLLLPSFAWNPALPGRKAAGLGTVIPSSVFKVTRHPMMWGFTFWAFAHMIASPTVPVAIMMTSIIVLALVGSHLQDKRKLAGNTREFGPWQRRTSFWPRLGKLKDLRMAWLVALLVWFIATWAHYQFFGIPAGIWMWIG